ncbi:transmembrane and coiled-coil domain-containing protein 5B-like [Meleagris gallopavo]|uniref:transmembrane and coiled-coil domain-containing protein 5B-like n=1 Tax=Meleagris gallopavo TaxID=9103 RepID=UPI000549C464|nr:transmembrane and coiled-coil domain-containing protein 5B-like [Meleagris gallopavo]
MRAQFASGKLTALQRVKLLQELMQAHERVVENHRAVARKSLMKESQQTQGERASARKEELEQEKQLITQLEKQLQAETEKIEALRQEKQRLQEEREELELESAWQQHQMELEAAHVPGAVLPELVEAQLEKKEQARRRGLAFWMQMICLILVCLQLLLVAVLGSAVLYAQHSDQELFYRLLPRVLPRAMYASLAYFTSSTLRVVCDGLLPI